MLYTANVLFKEEEYPEVESFIDKDITRLLKNVLSKIIEYYEQDYPGVLSFKIENSVEFVSDYEEEDYWKRIKSLQHHLSERGFKIQPVITYIENEDSENPTIGSLF